MDRSARRISQDNNNRDQRTRDEMASAANQIKREMTELKRSFDQQTQDLRVREDMRDNMMAGLVENQTHVTAYLISSEDYRAREAKASRDLIDARVAVMSLEMELRSNRLFHATATTSEQRTLMQATIHDTTLSLGDARQALATAQRKIETIELLPKPTLGSLH
jgi:hypothetical protein